jgi:hypothetical protein
VATYDIDPSGGGDYLTVEACLNGGSVANSDTLECYRGDIGGFADIDYEVLIRDAGGDGSERHDNTYDGGFSANATYADQDTSGDFWWLSGMANTSIQGIAFLGNSFFNNSNGHIHIEDSLDEIAIRKCLFITAQTNGHAVFVDLESGTYSGLYIWSNTFYRAGDSSNRNALRIKVNDTAIKCVLNNLRLVGNTIAGGYKYGIDLRADGTSGHDDSEINTDYFQNNLVVEATDGTLRVTEGNAWASITLTNCEYNGWDSDDTGDWGTYSNNDQVNLTPSNELEDPDTNWDLKNGATCIDAGTASVAAFGTDIHDDTRDLPWDIGSDYSDWEQTTTPIPLLMSGRILP